MCPSQPSTERTMRPLGSLAAGILRFASTCSFGVNTASGTPRAEALRGGNTAAAPRTEALRAEKRPEPRLAAELRLPVVGCRPSGHGNEGMGDAGAQSSSQPSSGDVVERRPPLSAAGLGLHAPTADDGADDDVGVAAMAPTAATGPARGRLGFRVPVEEGVAVAASRLVLRKEDCLEHGVGAALGTLRLRAMPEEGCLEHDATTPAAERSTPPPSVGLRAGKRCESGEAQDDSRSKWSYGDHRSRSSSCRSPSAPGSCSACACRSSSSAPGSNSGSSACPSVSSAVGSAVGSTAAVGSAAVASAAVGSAVGSPAAVGSSGGVLDTKRRRAPLLATRGRGNSGGAVAARATSCSVAALCHACAVAFQTAMSVGLTPCCGSTGATE
mmetsp:Transcript_56493/g.182994  ORF Transcript_56493/g.182994 Transcript_56493/m.182994 type:complete len:385 (-) Transcript_56493:2628-3782(-)